MTDSSDSNALLETALCTAELSRRSARAQDYAKESHALLALSRHLADSPRTILQKLADVALETLDAGSAGISLISNETGDFYWPAIAGLWRPHLGGGTPRNFGPCGVALDRNAVQLFAHPEKFYPYLATTSPVIKELLVSPFYVKEKAVGTVWVMSHDTSRRFDSEDQRLLKSLGTFASAAYEMLDSLATAEMERTRLSASDGDAQRAREYAEATLRTSPVPLLVLESDLTVVTANEAFYQRFQVAPADTEGQKVYDLGNRQWDIPKLRELLEDILPQHYTFQQFEVTHEFESIGRHTMLLNARRMEVEAGGSERIVLVLEDITDRKKAEEAIQASERRQRVLLKLSDALRSLADPIEIQVTAARMLAEELGLNRVFYFEVDPAGNYRTIDRDYVNGVLSMAGRDTMWHYSHQAREAWEAGQIAFSADVTADNLSADQRAALDTAQVRAWLGVPLHKAGRLVAVLTINQCVPRHWSAAEVELVKDAAERTWAAVEQARAEESLRLSEQRHRALAQNLPGGAAFIVDRDLRYLLAEGEALEAAGFTPQDLEGRTIYEALPAELATSYERFYRQALSGRPFLHEHNSHGRHYATRGTPLRGHAGDVCGVLAVSYDLTDRNRAEAELKRSEDQLRLITDAIPGLISYIDRTFCYRFVNRQYEEWFGQLPGAMLGKNVFEVLGEAAMQRLRPHMERALLGVAVRFEDEVPYREGGSRWIDAQYIPHRDESGDVRGLFVLVLDITHRKRAEEKACRATATMQEAQRIARIGNWEWDARSDATISSPELLRIYGFDPSCDVMPDFAAQRGRCYSETDWERISKGMQQAIETGQGYEFDVRVIRADGEHCWVTTRSEVVRTDMGEIVGLRGTVQDITERKQAEQALQEADRRKDEFLATLAHELRNPLAPIRSSIHLLSLHSQGDKSFDDLTAMLERQVNHMVRLVDDLMEASRISSGKIELCWEETSLAAIVRSAVDTSHPLIVAANHQLAISLPPEPVTLYGDPVRLAQVLSNLLNNAAKYTDAGGQIWLNAELPSQEIVLIHVRDTGIGIPPESLPCVFDMFMQVDRSSGRSQSGLGIGLHLVKRLVEMHGGTIEVRSDGPGVGSEFTVRLPCAVKASEPEPEATGKPFTIAPRHRVLVVDDNRDAVTSLAMLLKMLGSEVKVANDGATALSFLEDYQPNVILLDLGMPNMDGYEVARRIRESPQTERIILIALTGWGQEDARQRTQAAGFDQHLVKPASVTQLQAILLALEG